MAAQSNPTEQRVRRAKKVLVADNQRRLAELREAKEKVKAIMRPLEPWQRESIITSLTYYTKWPD